MNTVRRKIRTALASACGLLAASTFVLLATTQPATAADSQVAPAASPSVTRISGDSRYTTSKEVYLSRAWGNEAVVLASGEVPWDALAATPLAAVLNAPVVLTTPQSLHPATRDVLVDALSHGTNKVILAGGAASINPAVDSQILALGFREVVRHYGGDRYETALVLAQKTRAEYLSQGKNFNAVFFVDGTSVPDALATGPAAAAQNGAILLTEGRRVRPDILGNAQSYDVPMYAVGGAAVAALQGVHVGTVVGADRYDTAVKVARTHIHATRQLVVASGEDFPDALSGGAMAARFNGALVLTKPNLLPPVMSDFLEPGRFDMAIITGGPKSVSPSTFNRIRSEITGS